MYFVFKKKIPSILFQSNRTIFLHRFKKQNETTKADFYLFLKQTFCYHSLVLFVMHKIAWIKKNKTTENRVVFETALFVAFFVRRDRASFYQICFSTNRKFKLI